MTQVVIYNSNAYYLLTFKKTFSLREKILIWREKTLICVHLPFLFIVFLPCILTTTTTTAPFYSPGEAALTWEKLFQGGSKPMASGSRWSIHSLRSLAMTFFLMETGAQEISYPSYSSVPMFGCRNGGGHILPLWWSGVLYAPLPPKSQPPATPTIKPKQKNPSYLPFLPLIFWSSILYWNTYGRMRPCKYTITVSYSFFLPALFYDYQFALLNPFTFFHPAPQLPSPLATICIFCIWVFVLLSISYF